jgi:hypothetical protein
VSTENTTIGASIRVAPYQIAINIGGSGSRTSIGVIITSALRASFSFDDNYLSFQQDITFIAMTDNIVGSVDNNVCVAGKKFI